MTVQTIDVRFKRDVPAMSGRRLRSLLHQAWIAGNESYELPETAEGVAERNKDIAALLLKEGLAQPREKGNGTN